MIKMIKEVLKSRLNDVRESRENTHKESVIKNPRSGNKRVMYLTYFTLDPVERNNTKQARSYKLEINGNISPSTL
jgi:hypothetical protein